MHKLKKSRNYLLTEIPPRPRTWHISHATYKFLLLALTWDLITPNRQSILRDTRTVFSLPPVIVSLRIEHWCFILCQYKTNAGSSLAMPRVRRKQLSEATMETAVEKPGDACGLHVESLTLTNQHVRARRGAIEPWRACAKGSQRAVRVSRSTFTFFKWI